ncbi:ATP-binding protein [Maricaulis sp.]|uniref:ATP-binding protein n=1 Tax=Maricaulis sp. TaxID=1486257 RepID=UPI001B2D7CAB|nr:ATP-binding protein [Maricaulis sp.]MBO6796477.1 response regulator [Maricaulis sp.]
MTARGLTIRYVLALSLIALMAASVLGISLIAGRAASEDASLVNMSGRQRMLSQRIVMLTLEMQNEVDFATPAQRLENSIRLFARSHDDLVLAASMSDRILDIYLEPGTNLDALSLQFVELADRIKAGDATPTNMRELAERAEIILPVLDAATNAFTLEAERRVHFMDRLELTAFTITLFVLLLEGWFVFRPAVLSISKSMRELETARHDAERASAAKTSFLAQMSHEIRTPLNGVIGMATGLGTTKLDQEQRTMVTTLQSSGELLLTVVNDILDISKVEAGQVELEQADISLEQILNWIDSTYRPASAAKGLRWETRLADDAKGWYRGDATRIRQILSNLVSNAIKFTPDGEVHAEIRRLPDPATTDAHIEICVRDTGVGIPEDRIGAIFNPFEQADVSTTRKFGGTGLGLAISMRLAELMSGHIRVESTPGQGSRFTVTLALEPGEPPKPQIDLDTQPSDALASRLRALVVDDIATNRLVLQTLLAPLEVDVTCAGSGQEALDILDREHFDIVLMDIQMPEMNGVEATQQLRLREQRDGSQPTPVIAVTANVLPEQVAAYQAAGLDENLAKPVRREDLVELLTLIRVEHKHRESA